MKVKKLSKNEKEKINVIKEIQVTELVEGSSLFESNGYSRVKVTKNGEEQILVLPIKSGGISELIDELNKQAPTPPVVNKLVTPDSEIGRDLKLTRKKHVQIFDYTDPAYIEEKKEHDSNLGLTVVLFGVDVPVKDEEGTIIEDMEKKLKILQNLGLTGHQFSQIYKDISDLTTFAEEELDDFLD